MWNSGSHSESDYSIPLTEYGSQAKWARLRSDPRRHLPCLTGLFALIAVLALVFAGLAYANSQSASCASQSSAINVPESLGILPSEPKDVHMVGSSRDALPAHVRHQLDLSVPKVLVEAKDSADPVAEGPRRPNIFVFLADDLGYGDLASYGHPSQPWSALDEMASKGVRFTQLYADSFCTPSRAQFLTGRLAVRSGMQGQAPRVLLTGNPGGLPDSEITIAEALRDVGYATGMNGKWHMGINCERSDDGCHLPFHHGFDDVGTYFPVSNNLVCDETGRYSAYPNPQICFLYQGRGTRPWQAPAYKENITQLYLQEIKAFITKNRERPWFYTFNSPQTHDVMYASAQFRGSTERGEFGDALNEMGHAAGEIIRHLVSLDLAKDTLFLFYADNGAPTTDCLQAGNNGHMRSGKGTAWEGGVRVPGFVYWPGVLAPGIVSDALLTSADFFPTFAALAGARVPSDRVMDGRNLAPWLLRNLPQTREQSQRPLFFYCGPAVVAVRYQRYKIHFRTYNMPSDPSTECENGQPKFVANPVNRVLARQDCNDSRLATNHDPPLIFDVVADPSERFPLETKFHKEMLAEVREALRTQDEGLIRVPDQLQGFRNRLVPCCDASTNCICNYPFPERLNVPKQANPQFGGLGPW